MTVIETLVDAAELPNQFTTSFLRIFSDNLQSRTEYLEKNEKIKEVCPLPPICNAVFVLQLDLYAIP